MTICNELYEIASAYYGLQIKDPIYYALAKLVEDPKFELLQDMFNDDPDDFDKYLDYYFANNDTCQILANFSRMIYILNGRKAFYGPNELPLPGVELGDDNILYWVSVLGNELMHCGNKLGAGYNRFGIQWEGDGLISGSRIRAALFHILDILSKSNNRIYEEPSITVKTPFSFFGKEFDEFIIAGTPQGIGYLNPSDNLYYVDLVIKDIFSNTGVETRLPVQLGDSKLYDNNAVHYALPSGTSFGHSFYQISVMEGQTVKNATIDISFNSIRDTVTANPDDYDYELYNNNTLARTLLYKGNDELLAVPDKFEGAPTRKLGPLTYYGKKIKKIYVIDGITVIE